MQILTINADFCYDSRTPDANPKIVEINEDNLSKYVLAQNVGRCPRQSRLKRLKMLAKEASASLYIVYTERFLEKPDKAKRWGIDDIEVLKENMYFCASTEGIQSLKTAISSQGGKSWILLLGIYFIRNINIHLYADPTQRRIQDDLKQLSESDNTVVIGSGGILEPICYDKFLSAYYLPKDAQPQYALLLHGAHPDLITMQDINRSVTSEHTIIKPLEAAGGTGVTQFKTKKELTQQLTDMTLSSVNHALHSTQLDLNRQRSSKHYWEISHAESPFALCQSYETSDISPDGKLITYRAVFTVVISDSGEINVHIEYIYPKKADIGDFVSRKQNTISSQEVDVISSNDALCQKLKQAIEELVKNVMKHNFNDTIKSLLKSNNIAECMIGVSYTQDKSAALAELDSKCKALIETSPQAAISLQAKMALYGITLEKQFSLDINDAPIEVLLKLALLKYQNSKTDQSQNEYVTQFSTWVLKAFSIRSMIAALPDHSDRVLYTNETFYRSVITFMSEANLLLRTDLPNALRLAIHFNLFELRQMSMQKYPSAGKMFQPEVEKSSSNAEMITLLTTIDSFEAGNSAERKTLHFLSDEMLLAAIAATYNIINTDPPANLIYLTININHPDPSYYIRKILDAFYVRYADIEFSKEMKINDPALIYSLFCEWQKNTSPLMPDLTPDLEWHKQSQAGQYLLVAQTKDEPLAKLFHFLTKFLDGNENEFIYCKVLESLSTIVTIRDSNKIIFPDTLLQLLTRQKDRLSWIGVMTPAMETAYQQIIAKETAASLNTMTLFNANSNSGDRPPENDSGKTNHPRGRVSTVAGRQT